MTILAINETDGAPSSAIAITNLNLPSTAQVYTYSHATLTSIVHAFRCGDHQRLDQLQLSQLLGRLVCDPTRRRRGHSHNNQSLCIRNPNHSRPEYHLQCRGYPCGRPGNVTLLDGSAPLGTSALASGAATFPSRRSPPGPIASLLPTPGTTTDGASTSNAVSIQVSAATAPLQATTVTLTANPATAVSGQTITLSANVAPTSGTSIPTGTVTFQDGSTAIGSSPLAAGAGTLAISTLSVGTHSLTAAYSGDASNSPSASKALW